MHQIFSIAKSTVNLFILTCTGRDVLCWITLCYVKHIKWSKGMKINVWQDKETDYSGVWVDRFYCTIKSVVWDATVYKGHWPLRLDVCTLNIPNYSSLLYYVTYFTVLSSLCTLLTPKTFVTLQRTQVTQFTRWKATAETGFDWTARAKLTILFRNLRRSISFHW